VEASNSTLVIYEARSRTLQDELQVKTCEAVNQDAVMESCTNQVVVREDKLALAFSDKGKFGVTVAVAGKRREVQHFKMQGMKHETDAAKEMPESESNSQLVKARV
jgi:hypothetical protein